METKIFEIKFSEIEIPQKEVFGLMGYKSNDIPEHLLEIFHAELKSFADIKLQGGYGIVSGVYIDTESNSIKCDNTVFETGKSVSRLLRKSEKIALFICTTGDEIPNRSKELTNNGDLLEGYVVDIIGSVAVEKAMDKIHKHIKAEALERGLKVSNRYSPGYCDWNVSEQKKLFSFFPEHFCGVSLSDSCLMHPIKSVSGFIGIGKDIKYNPYTCEICTSVNCIYRNMTKESKSL